jgi:hypothetical protein
MNKILSKDLMAQLDAYQSAVGAFGQEDAPSVSGGDIQYGSGGCACRANCMENCYGGCEGSCKGTCSYSCQYHSR